MKLLTLPTLTLWLALLAPMAQASLVSRDFASANDGLLTFDTQTNLEWLDVTQTTNLSFQAVSTMLLAGGSFAGFRYATSAEVSALYSYSGISTTFGAFANTGQAGNIQTLINLVGQTGFPSGGFPGPATRAIYGNGFNANSHLLATMGIRSTDSFTTAVIGQDFLGAYTFADNVANVATGSFLVRVSSVPEPSSLAYLVTGVLALLSLSKLRARKRDAR